MLITKEVKDKYDQMQKDEPVKAQRLKMKIIDSRCWDKLQIADSFQQSERGTLKEEGFYEFVDKATWIARVSACPGQDLESAKCAWKKRENHIGQKFERVIEGNVKVLKVPLPTRAGQITARKKVTRANKKTKHTTVAVAKAMLRRTSGRGRDQLKQNNDVGEDGEMSEASGPSDVGGGFGFANEI